jgi:hypothetical protein
MLGQIIAIVFGFNQKNEQMGLSYNIPDYIIFLFPRGIHNHAYFQSLNH